MFFILAGNFAIEINGRTVSLRGPNECVGEMAATMTALPRSATARAIGPASVLAARVNSPSGHTRRRYMSTAVGLCGGVHGTGNDASLTRGDTGTCTISRMSFSWIALAKALKS